MSVGAVVAYGKFPAQEGNRISVWIDRALCGEWDGGFYPPTFEDASVSEFSVLDLPALGLPTRPIRGSRGMLLRFWRDSGIRLQKRGEWFVVGASGSNSCR